MYERTRTAAQKTHTDEEGGEKKGFGGRSQYNMKKNYRELANRLVNEPDRTPIEIFNEASGNSDFGEACAAVKAIAALQESENMDFVRSIASLL